LSTILALVALSVLPAEEERPRGAGPSSVLGAAMTGSDSLAAAFGEASQSTVTGSESWGCPGVSALDPAPPNAAECPSAQPVDPVDGAQFRFRRTANLLTLRARYQDANGGADNRLEFKVFGSDGRVVASKLETGVRSGDVTWRLPPGVLHQGELYSWTVRGYDPTRELYSHPAEPSRFRGVVVGASMHPLWADGDDFERGLDLLRDSGATAVRIDLIWGKLEDRGAASFSDRIGGDPHNGYAATADRFFEAARRRGLGVIVDLWGTPCWASTAPGRDCADANWWETQPLVGRSPPSNPGAYAGAAAKVVRRWGASIEALEVWNEPNSESFLAAGPCQAVDDCPGADAYARLLKAGYSGVKRASPRTRVLGGVIAGADARYLEWLYAPGRSIRGFHDGISAHPYDFERPGLPGTADLLEVMEEHGEADRGLWITELGQSTCTDAEDGSRCTHSEDDQATYLGEALDSETGPRSDERIRALVIYNLRDKAFDSTFDSNFGIVKRSFEPKPAYSRVRDLLFGVSAR